MPRVMRDSTSPGDIPVAGTDLAAGYVNGSYAWSAAGWARFPNAGHVTIDVNGSRPDADVLDVEPGDATVAGGVVWLRKALAVSGRGYPPVIYCNRSNRSAFVTAAAAAGFKVDTHFKFWVATLDGTRTLSDMTGVAAVQWAGANQTGGHYDQSDVFDPAWKAAADVALTQADANLIVNTLLGYKMDDPTTADNSTKTLKVIWWDTGRNAFQGDSRALTLQSAVSSLALTLSALSGRVPDGALASVQSKLDTLQAAVTDPTGLVNQIKTELESFQLVFQQKTGA